MNCGGDMAARLTKTVIGWRNARTELPRAVSAQSSWPVLFRIGKLCYAGFYSNEGWFQNEISDIPVFRVKAAEVTHWVYMAEIMT